MSARRQPYATEAETRLQLLLRLRALELGLKRPDKRYISDLDLSIAQEEKAEKKQKC